jgi:hypothetical protein
MPEHWDPLAGVEPDDIRLFLVEALSIAVGLPHHIAQPELAKFIDEAAMIGDSMYWKGATGNESLVAGLL